MAHYTGKFRGAGDLELFYQCWETDVPNKANLLIIHGFGEHSGRYMNLVDHLVPRGYTVWGFDHRGHGRSPGQRGHINSWQEFREDVRSFVQMVREKEQRTPIFIFGHSLGGLIALEFALHYPEGLKGVIASSPALAQVGVSPLLLALSKILSALCPRISINIKLNADFISRDKEVVRAYREDPLVHSLATPRLGPEMDKAKSWTMEHAQEWKLPLLILQGTADSLVSPEGSRIFFERVPIKDKKLIEYEGGYHESHNDLHSEQVMKDLEAWLEAHLAQSI